MRDECVLYVSHEVRRQARLDVDDMEHNSKGEGEAQQTSENLHLVRHRRSEQHRTHEEHTGASLGAVGPTRSRLTLESLLSPLSGCYSA